MKNVIIIFAVTAISLTVLSFTDSESITNIQSGNTEVVFSIPADVQVIIDKSCYGCHNSESSSMKGKMKLNFDKMPDMRTGKLVGKLSKISKSINKGKMPTKKFLDKYPENALTKEEANILTSWADNLAQEYSGE